jgi:hypothetical protein
MVLIASPACFSHPQPLTYRIEFDYNWLLKSVGRTGRRSLKLSGRQSVDKYPAAWQGWRVSKEILKCPIVVICTKVT